MHTVLATLLVALAPQGAAPAYYAVPLEELQLAEGVLLPSYGGQPPWERWGAGVEVLPWAVLEGEGEAELRIHDPSYYDGEDGSNGSHRLGALVERQGDRGLGELCVRTGAARELAGTLYLPKASGGGFLKLPFRVPAERATASAKTFQRAELERCRRLLQLRVPGGAWFRHRFDAQRAALGADAPAASEPQAWNAWRDFREPVEALELFSGGRALYENLQLERGLPASADGEATVALDSLEGLTVRAIDWKPLLTDKETKLDALAALVPADQHALFFPSFPGFVRVLEEADRLGSFGLSAFEQRSSDAQTKQRYERQLGLELSQLARTFGPLVVESVALTGSDAYLRTGSTLALLFRSKTPEVVRAYVAARQDAAEGEHLQGTLAGIEYRGVANATRSLSSYVATVKGVVVVANALSELERVARTANGETPALAASDEYRFFRQRYVLGAADESALVVLSDAAIRRWCSPRWRIGGARVARAAAELSEEHAAQLELLAGGSIAPKDLGFDKAFPLLGALRLTPEGVHSAAFGTLDFLTPIAELALDKVTPREAALYRTWKEGYEQAWSNFFDPIGCSLSVKEKATTLDLSVRPLILGTEYDWLRKVTAGAGLAAESGDPHPEALVQFVLALNPEWEELKSIGATLGSAAEKLGVDPLSWLGPWVTLYADAGPFWDELEQTEDLDEALASLQSNVNQIPLALEVAVANPLKLALFMTGLRAFADGTAPGLAVWKERVVGERRFVEITSPGLGQQFSLFYATQPSELILSLNEPTLLRAMEREEKRRAGEATPAGAWRGAHAALALQAQGLLILERWFGTQLTERLRGDAWRNLPILNEWHRLHPELDPVALHERVFRERLLCPGGGTYSWNAEWNTLESSVYGHPGAPKLGPRRPAGWDDLGAARFGLTFEEGGLRVRAALERR